MTTKNLGTLTPVDLRKVWSSEAGHFTPWLAQAANLKLLGDTIGIELEFESQEKNVGPFRADILCKNTINDSWVLIENQIERTDHTHLGQLITYAAGLDAVTIVWIAERFTEEHRAALDWLNEHTDDKINCFGLEIELWQIGESPIAPKFNIISQPNEWSRSAQRAAARGALTEHNQLQLRFWTAFRDYVAAKGSFLRCQKPLPQNWTNLFIGRSGVHLAVVISTQSSDPNTKGREIRAELYLDGPGAKEQFEKLQSQKEQIEKQLEFGLVWYNVKDNASCRAYVRRDADFLDERQWPEQFEWLRQKLENMHRIFAPIVKTL